MRFEPVNIIAGHYGVGKTTLALNLALQAAGEGLRVVLADLDVVNPYFRSTEYRALLEDADATVIAPAFSEAGSNVDAPGLNGAIVPAIEAASACAPLIIDAGGDDVGATALGRFAKQIEAKPHAFIYVVNPLRLETREVDEAVRILHEIEHASHLRATSIVCNAHLMNETDLNLVTEGADFAQLVAETTGLPLTGITVPASWLEDTGLDVKEVSQRARLEALADVAPLIPITPYVRTPWQELRP